MRASAAYSSNHLPPPPPSATRDPNKGFCKTLFNRRTARARVLTHLRKTPPSPPPPPHGAPRIANSSPAAFDCVCVCRRRPKSPAGITCYPASCLRTGIVKKKIEEKKIDALLHDNACVKDIRGAYEEAGFFLNKQKKKHNKNNVAILCSHLVYMGR